MDKRIEEIEKCQDYERDTLMIHLVKGYCINDQGCHTFGVDDRRELRATMRQVKPCRCGECS